MYAGPKSIKDEVASKKVQLNSLASIGGPVVMQVQADAEAFRVIGPIGQHLAFAAEH